MTRSTSLLPLFLDFAAWKEEVPNKLGPHVCVRVCGRVCMAFFTVG